MDRLTFAQILVKNYYGNPANFDEIVQFFVAVMTGEGSKAWFNPLDTEFQLGYILNYNSAGVKNYLTIYDGYKATVGTLALPYYDGLNAKIKDSTSSALEIALEFSRTPWGYIGDRLPAEIVQDFNRGTLSYVTERRALIGVPPVNYFGINSSCEFLPALDNLVK